MATDQERLIVSLEARVNQFEKNFKKASKSANDNFGKIERRAKQSGNRMEEYLGNSTANVANNLNDLFGKVTIGVTAVAGLVTAFRKVAGSIAEVDREARKAGVSAKVWQQWAYVATATGATIDGITDALKEMNIRANEFALTGKGSGAEWFARLGYTAEEVAEKLKDPNRFLDEIIAKIQTLDRASQTRALDELFGGTGAEQLAKVLGYSVQEIQKMRSEAATFSQEQIEAAKKIDREFATLWRNFTVYAKQATLEGVGYLSKIINGISWLKGDDYIAGLREDFLAPEAQIARLQARRARLAAKIASVEAETPGSKAEQQQRAAYLKSLRKSLADVEKQLFDLTGGSEEYNQAMVELSAITVRAAGGFDTAANSAANFKSALRELKEMVPELKGELDTLAKSDAIDAAYRKAVSGATTMGQIKNATAIANRAHASLEIKALPSNVISRGKKVYDLLREQGLAHAAAAGIVGNVYQESRFDPTAMGDGGTSHGLFQHHGSRMSDLVGFGGRNNAALQVAFAVQEMKRSGLFDRINAMTDPAAAARLFMTEFEKPATATANLASRQEFARLAGGWGDPGMWEAPKAPDLDPWKGLREVTAETRDNMGEMTNQAQQFGSIAGNAVAGLVNALADGKITAQEFSQILAQIAQQLIQMALSGISSGKGGGGGFGGFLSSFLGGLLGFAGGGHVRGPGTSTSDSIPARLSDGEYVINAAATRQHLPLLEAINSGRVPRFAHGGPVGSIARQTASTGKSSFSTNINVNVEGGSRGEEADEELASGIATRVKQVVDERIQQFAVDQMRSGGLFSGSRGSL